MTNETRSDKPHRIYEIALCVRHPGGEYSAIVEGGVDIDGAVDLETSVGCVLRAIAGFLVGPRYDPNALSDKANRTVVDRIGKMAV